MFRPPGPEADGLRYLLDYRAKYFRKKSHFRYQKYVHGWAVGWVILMLYGLPRMARDTVAPSGSQSAPSHSLRRVISGERCCMRRVSVDVCGGLKSGEVMRLVEESTPPPWVFGASTRLARLTSAKAPAFLKWFEENIQAA
jgi:hypothetical protein